MSASTKPKISLAIPVYNGEIFISECIESILAQTFRNFELIITDNASVDFTQLICEKHAQQDPRIRYIRNDANIGAAANYNRGFELATGEYLKWCAHDDRISPNFLESCVTALDSDPTVVLAFGSTVGIDPDGEQLESVGDETPSLMDARPSMRFIQAIRLAGTCFPIFGLFRMSALRRSLLHQPYYGSDRALLAEIALLGRFLRVDDAIFYNREHQSRSIRIDDKLARSQWQTGTRSRRAAAEHLNLARHLTKIALRHPDISPPLSTISRLVPHLLSPTQIGRYALEVTSMVSPQVGAWAKSRMGRSQAA